METNGHVEPSVKPESGKPLDLDDFEEIVNAYKKRRENFPEEKIEMSLGLILFNLGDRYATVTCVGEHEGGPWTSLKKDATRRGDGGIPICPYGHPLTQTNGMRLAWVDEPED